MLALAGWLLAAGPAAAQSGVPASATLQDQLNGWYKRAARAAPGEWGVAVADEQGRLLWGVNPASPMIPASTVKLFTAGFARSTLGGDARQTTRVVGTGYVEPLSGAWIGSWALEFNGDPTFERPMRQGATVRDLAAQLAAIGIRRLTGPLGVQSGQGEANATYPAVWASRHRGRSFAPLVGALTLNENLINFTLAPGVEVGAPPRVTASAPIGMDALVHISAKTVAGSRDRLRILAAPGGRFEVQGTMGLNARRRYFAGTARDLTAVLEAAWDAALREAGIEWERGDAVAVRSPSVSEFTLAEVVSPPLDSIVAEVNTRSLNIGAEALLRWAGGPSDQAAERLTEHVRQVTGESQVHLVDGSGLSGDDRATAYSFVKYLATLPAMPAGRNFPFLLPANGDGTLKRLTSSRLTPGVVRAKTGTLGNVSSLVGYLGHKDGLLLVSVLYNGSRVSTAKQQQWQLFRVLGADGTAIPGETGSSGLGSESEPPNNPR